MINWILAFLGIMMFFITKYAKRNSKHKAFSFGFWLADNWEETVVSIMATFVLMIMFLSPEAQFDTNAFFEKVPFITALPTKMVVSFLAGFSNSFLIYAMFRNKTKK